MIRRDFFRQSLFPAGSAYTVGRAPLAPLQAVAQDVPALDVTRYVSQFIVETEFEEIPEDAMANGKKHVLDGFGLAVSGSASEMGPRMRQYLRTLGFEGGTASVIGSAMKVPAGFAALANGVSIHAHDFDDTGGNGHPTVTVLPPAFALSEAGRRSGRDLLLAYHIGVEVESRLAAAVAGDNNAFHGTAPVWVLWQRGGLRKAARPRRDTNGECVGNRRHSGSGTSRQFRHDDEAAAGWIRVERRR